MGPTRYLRCVFCFAFALKSFSAGKKLAPLFYVLSYLAIVIEHYNYDYPIQPQIQRPEIFAALEKKDTKSSTAIVLPYAGTLTKDGYVKDWGKFSELNVLAMQWTVSLRTRFINGYSGQSTWVIRNLPRKLSDFPDRRSINMLSYFAGLRYVVLITSEIPGFNHDTFAKQLAEFSDELKIVERDDAGNLLLEYTGVVENRSTYFSIHTAKWNAKGQSCAGRKSRGSRQFIHDSRCLLGGN